MNFEELKKNVMNDFGVTNTLKSIINYFDNKDILEAMDEINALKLLFLKKLQETDQT